MNQSGETCPVCVTSDNPAVESLAGFTIRQCRTCTLQYADPLHYDEAAYSEAYYRNLPNASRDSQLVVPSLQWLREAGAGMKGAEALLTTAQVAGLGWLRQQLPAGATLLDCGSGTGWFLAAARRTGFDVYGVEVAGPPVQILQQYGFAVLEGSVADLDERWPTMSAVTLFEVLEHLSDPLAMLRSLRQRCPEALLVLSVPCSQRWSRLWGKADIADFPPNHLTRWSAGSLRFALTRAGYEPLAVQPVPLRAAEMATASWRALLRAWRNAGPDVPLAAVLPQESLRTLPRELEARRRRSRWMAPLALLGRMAGKSGFSLLAMAQPDNGGSRCAAS